MADKKPKPTMAEVVVKKMIKQGVIPWEHEAFAVDFLTRELRRSTERMIRIIADEAVKGAQLVHTFGLPKPKKR